MKTFDFDKSLEMGHTPGYVEFLKQYHKKKITIDEYIEKVKALPKKPGSDRSPSRLKADYKNLTEKFGFFQ